MSDRVSIEPMVYAAVKSGWPGYVAISVCDGTALDRRLAADMLADCALQKLEVERVLLGAALDGLLVYAAERIRRRDADRADR